MNNVRMERLEPVLRAAAVRCFIHIASINIKIMGSVHVVSTAGPKCSAHIMHKQDDASCQCAGMSTLCKMQACQSIGGVEADTQSSVSKSHMK